MIYLSICIYSYIVNVEADFHHLSHSLNQKYISCLSDQKDKHYLCRELSKEYLQCRMDRQLMASEDLDKVRLLFLNSVKFWSSIYHLDSHYFIIIQLGYSEDAKIESAVEYDKLKEKEGYVAGKHIDGRVKWWFQRLW